MGKKSRYKEYVLYMRGKDRVKKSSVLNKLKSMKKKGETNHV